MRTPLHSTLRCRRYFEFRCVRRMVLAESLTTPPSPWAAGQFILSLRLLFFFFCFFFFPLLVKVSMQEFRSFDAVFISTLFEFLSKCCFFYTFAGKWWWGLCASKIFRDIKKKEERRKSLHVLRFGWDYLEQHADFSWKILYQPPHLPHPDPHPRTSPWPCGCAQHVRFSLHLSDPKWFHSSASPATSSALGFFFPPSPPLRGSKGSEGSELSFPAVAVATPPPPPFPPDESFQSKPLVLMHRLYSDKERFKSICN